MSEDTTEDRLLGGTLRLIQPKAGHRAGTDAVLLAGLADCPEGGLAIDLGSASGAVGLILARRHPSVRVVLIERDPQLVALADRNIALNGMADRLEAVQADAFALRAEALPGTLLAERRADLVVTNPPFFEGRSRVSPNENRRDAHDMRGGDLTGWLKGAASCLAPRGRLALIHRADHMRDCLAAMPKAMGGITVRPIHPRAGQEASRVVIMARLGSRAPLMLLPPIILHGPDGRFTQEVEALHGPGDPGPGGH